MAIAGRHKPQCVNPCFGPGPLLPAERGSRFIPARTGCKSWAFQRRALGIQRRGHRLADNRTMATNKRPNSYRLDEQVGYKLRLANQRHLDIFSQEIPHITPTQFAVLARLKEIGEISQNHLGRRVGMNAATTKGVVERLTKKELIAVTPSKTDRRRLMITLTAAGDSVIGEAIEQARLVTEKTLANLSPRERSRLNELLDKL